VQLVQSPPKFLVAASLDRGQARAQLVEAVDARAELLGGGQS
jgi:hypothetical protein